MPGQRERERDNGEMWHSNILNSSYVLHPNAALVAQRAAPLIQEAIVQRFGDLQTGR